MTIEFRGEEYYDDRLFVFYICKVTAEIVDGVKEIILHHDEAPDDHVWALVLYKNTGRMMAAKVNYFRIREDAEEYYRDIAPQVPRISLNGESPLHPPSFKEYSDWMAREGLSEYDKKAFYSSSGSNQKEVIYEQI